MNRRNFLRGAAVAPAAVLLPGVPKGDDKPEGQPTETEAPKVDKGREELLQSLAQSIAVSNFKNIA